MSGRGPHGERLSGAPTGDRLVEVQLRARLAGEPQGDLERGLRKQHPGPRLEERNLTGLQLELGKALASLELTELLVRQPMLPGAPSRPGDEGAAGRPDHESAGGDQQLAIALFLERGPPLIGSLHQRHVLRMLEVGLPDDAALAVGRPEGVGGPKSIEADNPLAPARQLERRHAAHGAEPNDTDVEGGGHGAASYRGSGLYIRHGVRGGALCDHRSRASGPAANRGRLPAPDLVVPNTPATSYVRVRLDQRSLETLRYCVSELDPATRAVCLVAVSEVDEPP